MSHDLVRILGQLAFVAIVFFVPGLYAVYSDRFQVLPSPGQFSVLLGIVTVGGILIGVPALSVAGATILLGVGLARLSAGRALTHVNYRCELTPSRVFPGDDVEVTIRVENRKLLPLSWIHIVDPIRFKQIRNDRRLEDAVRFSGGVRRLESGEPALVTDAAIGPMQSLTRRYRATAIRRGVYTVGPARAESGDPFGIFERSGAIGAAQEMMVYPRVYTPDQLSVPFREGLGELIPHRALLEDPTLLAGSREYRPGDPLHRMHWKASARSGELQVRVCDPSTTANLMLVVNMNTHQYSWHGVDVGRMEATIDGAASIAVWGLERGYAVGMRANGLPVGAEHAARIPPSANPRQIPIILEYLARLTSSSRYSPRDILLAETRHLEERTTLIFVTANLSPDLISILTSPRLINRVSVVYCGGYAAPVVRGLPVTIMVPPEPIRVAS